jgi:hypothetical protein
MAFACQPPVLIQENQWMIKLAQPDIFRCSLPWVVVIIVACPKFANKLRKLITTVLASLPSDFVGFISRRHIHVMKWTEVRGKIFQSKPKSLFTRTYGQSSTATGDYLRAHIHDQF